MPTIELLSRETIDKIAAGEVVERPSSVVKELVENAIDAGAGAVTVEIKEGGTRLIRVTDNGSGIAKDQVPLAFLRHSTSKIRSAKDLIGVRSLGFRGEALSSISAVSRIELITKTKDALTGITYVIEGGKELSVEETGAPDGTTFMVKDLFYNTPARRKFLKTPQTEGNYIQDLMERLALSHPEISFKFINNDKTKMHTSGNGKSKDVIYHIYGRDITAALLPVDIQGTFFSVKGFLAKPEVVRGNRNFENYFINHRYIKSKVITKAIEDAYDPYVMERQYPFTVLYFTFNGKLLDVNVHPTKMELRFEHDQEIYLEICEMLGRVLSEKELIREVSLDKKKPERRSFPENPPESFRQRKINEIRTAVAKDSPYSRQYPDRTVFGNHKAYTSEEKIQTSLNIAEKPARKLGAGVCEDVRVYGAVSETLEAGENLPKPTESRKLTEIPERYAGTLTEGENSLKQGEEKTQQLIQNRLADIRQGLLERKGAGHSEAPFSPEFASQMPKAAAGDENDKKDTNDYEEMTLASIDPAFLSKEGQTGHRIIGQLFETYWLVEYRDKLYIIDQHAAHEKVLYEQTMAKLNEKEYTSQMLSPPIILTLDLQEIEMLEKYRPQIEQLGYVVEPFGGKEYQICGIPGNLYNMDMKDLFIEMLDEFSGLSGRATPQMITEKVASMSCKAAVKGNNKLSMPEIEQLITDLLALENPYNCPHGRPTIISMSKYEIEKSFKRIV